MRYFTCDAALIVRTAGTSATSALNIPARSESRCGHLTCAKTKPTTTKYGAIHLQAGVAKGMNRIGGVGEQMRVLASHLSVGDRIGLCRISGGVASLTPDALPASRREDGLTTCWGAEPLIAQVWLVIDLQIEIPARDARKPLRSCQ